MKPFSLDHLTSTEFENFCFDLLGELGFVNISWRKGTGLSSSPSDSGRDIECKSEVTDIDGNKYFETWFVECKHYTEGVPPTKIQGILAWAAAEIPDKVLIITSNFLSNPAKDSLASYERNNRPKFKIRIWEKPDIERLTVGLSQLLKKYRIVGEFPFVQILHPAHLLYMKGLQFNSIGYLFECLDGLDVQKRDEILHWAYESIIKPRYRESTNENETLGDLRIDEVSYNAFKKKCKKIIESKAVSEIQLTFLIVNITLNAWISMGDITSTDEPIERTKSFIEFIQQLINDDLPLDNIDEYAIELLKDKEKLKHMMELLKERMPQVRENTQRYYELYVYFCENVVARLLQENLFENYNQEYLKKRFLAKKPPNKAS